MPCKLASVCVVNLDKTHIKIKLKSLLFFYIKAIKFHRKVQKMTFTSHINRHGTKNCHQHYNTGLSLSFEAPVSSQSFFIFTPVANLWVNCVKYRGAPINHAHL